MKKIIVTAVVVGVAAIAASAQTTKLYNTEAKYIQQEQRASKVQTQRVDTLQKAIEKEAAAQARAAQNKTQAAKTGTAADAASTKGAPAKKATTCKKTKATSKAAPKKSDSKETSVLGCIGECIKVAFTGARFPGESADSYSARQEAQRYAFAQPYK